MYPVDRQDSVISGPRVPLGLARLSPFSPPRTLGSGGTQSFHAPKHPWNWRDSVRSGPQVALGLAGLAISAPQVPLGRARLSHFSPPSTLETGSFRRTVTGESSSPKDWYGYSDDCAHDTFRARFACVYGLVASKRRFRQRKTCIRKTCLVDLCGTFYFACFALSEPPFTCSQGIQVHQARFLLHFMQCLNLRLLAAGV